ncbi:hypothetical protein JCM13304A_02880 [Desulfothermus okinawensis JCM 13304]
MLSEWTYLIDRLEGISHSVGYLLENKAYKSLPLFLFVAHDFPPDIEGFLNMHNIAYVWSYEFE